MRSLIREPISILASAGLLFLTACGSKDSNDQSAASKPSAVRHQSVSPSLEEIRLATLTEAAKKFKGTVTPSRDHLVFTWSFKQDVDNGVDHSESATQYLNHSIGFVRSAFATDTTIHYVKTIAQMEDDSTTIVLSHVWFRSKIEPIDWKKMKHASVFELLSGKLDSIWSNGYYQNRETLAGLLHKNIHLFDLPPGLKRMIEEK